MKGKEEIFSKKKEGKQRKRKRRKGGEGNQYQHGKVVHVRRKAPPSRRFASSVLKKKKNIPTRQALREERLVEGIDWTSTHLQEAVSRHQQPKKKGGKGGGMTEGHKGRQSEKTVTGRDRDCREGWGLDVWTESANIAAQGEGSALRGQVTV